MLLFFVALMGYISVSYFPDAETLALKNYSADQGETEHHFSILNFSLFTSFEEQNNPATNYSKSLKNVFLAKLPFSSKGWTCALLPRIISAGKSNILAYFRIRINLDTPTIIFPFHSFW